MTHKKKKTVPEKTHSLRSRHANVTKPYEPVPRKRTLSSLPMDVISTSTPASSQGHGDNSLDTDEQQQGEPSALVTLAFTAQDSSVSSETRDMLIDPLELDDQQQRQEILATPG